MNTSFDSIVIIFSGGMDSGTLLWDLYTIAPWREIHALTFDYGQRHKREIECAKRFIKECDNVTHKVISLDVLNDVAPSCLTRPSMEVPHGAYDGDNMRTTVVPNRNMVMLSLAISYAIGIGAGNVYYGAHAGDHTIYPDCRPEFVDAMNIVSKLCDWSPVEIIAPYLNYTKGQIAELGVSIGVPYELTHTCYEGSYPPCGKCGSCVERAEAFEYAGVPDPLLRKV
jgi:7-cyano-7-deazaguanine synthase